MELLVTLISGVLGCSNLVGFLLFYSASRRSKEAEAGEQEATARLRDAEARLKDVEVKDKDAERYDRRLDSLHEDIEVLNKQLSVSYKDKARSEEIIADKTAQIRKLNEMVLDKEGQIGRLRLVNNWLWTWRCERVQGDRNFDPECCDRRRPPHPFPMPFEPPVGLSDVCLDRALCEQDLISKEMNVNSGKEVCDE